ncbi:MAG: nuclease-related domain-containing protein [Actinomycetota bacterium]
MRPGTARLLPPSLATDPRVGGWIFRAVISFVAGLAVGIWQDWRLGLTAAAVVAIADTILRARHSSVLPASATVSIAQRKTRRHLAKLKRAGWTTLNGRAIPGSDQVIDHLVIGPAGVFAVDSELWDKRLPIRTWNGLDIFHGPYSHTERLEHARWEAAQASRLVSAALRQRVVVRPAMVIYGPKVPWTVVRLVGVDVFAGDRLVKYMRTEARAKARAAERLDAAQIGVIHAAAEKALPPIG